MFFRRFFVFLLFRCYNLLTCECFLFMEFNKTALDHLAKLARLDIDAADKEKCAEQIASVLDYFEKLNSIDTENVEPLDFVTDLKNIWREDAQKVIYSRDKVLAESPELKDGQIVVPRVFGKT